MVQQSAQVPGFYGDLDAAVVTFIRDRVAVNSRAITEAAKKDLNRIEAILDLQYRIARHYLWAFGTLFDTSDVEKLMYSAFHKNMLIFFSSLELTRMGLFGPAFVLLRQTLEWLAVGKFCAASQQSDALERWVSGEPVHLSRHVFARVQRPDLAPIREL